jgi:hypothetical protein
VVVTYHDTPSALKILQLVQAHAPKVPVVVRTIDDSDLERLQAAGATEVVPEAIEGSLMLASHALALVGVPMRRVLRVVQEQRDARYGLLRGYFHGADDDTVDELMHARLLTVTVPAGSRAVGPLDRQRPAARRRRHGRVRAARLRCGPATGRGTGARCRRHLVLSGRPEPLARTESSSAAPRLARARQDRALESERFRRWCLARHVGAHPDRHHGPGRTQQLERQRGRTLGELLHPRSRATPRRRTASSLDVRHPMGVAEEARLADHRAGAQDRNLAALRRSAGREDLHRALRDQVHRAIGIALLDQHVTGAGSRGGRGTGARVRH